MYADKYFSGEQTGPKPSNKEPPSHCITSLDFPLAHGIVLITAKEQTFVRLLEKFQKIVFEETRSKYYHYCGDENASTSTQSSVQSTQTLV